jgi:phage terminase large subunit
MPENTEKLAFDYKSPDYDAVYAERARRLSRIRADANLLPALKEYYKANPVAFINDWGMTFDPRNAERGIPTVIPFVLFPKQEEFVTWTYELWSGREDGLAEKCRDMGVSWLCVAVAVHMMLFHAGTVIGFGSRKEEYVDKLSDPKSLFWKVRQFIKLLPAEFRPTGWNEKTCAPFMNIKNPENGSYIVGEAGDNIGRGNRTSIYFKDESAFYERPDSIDAALSQTSNCKIDVSTPNGNGNPFYRKRHSGKVKVFSFRWQDDPRKGDEWYQKQVRTLDSVILAQEVNIDYNASTSDAFIDGELIASAQRKGPADVEAVGQWCIGIDAAHFGDDETVIHSRRGRLNLPQITLRQCDGIAIAHKVEDHCRELESAGGEIWSITIELDGPGVSAYDQLKRGPYALKVKGVHTGARLSDDKNYNIRALMWRDALEYLQDGPVCLPPDGELKSQLGSVKYKYKDGLMLMQSKKEYKSMYGKSPDRADAFVLTFVNKEAPKKKARPNQRATAGGWMG